LRNAEISDLRCALRIEEHVPGLDVAMDQSPPVRVRKARGDLASEPFRLVVWRRLSGAQLVLECPSVEVFEHDVRPAVRLAVVIELADRGM
jgi:hypothetical protein